MSPGRGLSPSGQRVPGFKYLEHGLDEYVLGSVYSSPTGGVYLKEAYNRPSKVQGPPLSGS